MYLSDDKCRFEAQHRVMKSIVYTKSVCECRTGRVERLKASFQMQSSLLSKEKVLTDLTSKFIFMSWVKVRLTFALRKNVIDMVK